MNFGRRIFADNDTLLEHVPASITGFLDHAIGAIDERFGEGYAKLHPELVTAYVEACTLNLGHAFIARALESCADAIRDLGDFREIREKQ